MISQHASVKPDKLSQHAKHRQTIPACIEKKNTIYKGLLVPRTTDKQWTSRITVGVRRAQLRRSAEPTLQHYSKYGKA